jgi:hypothetical protein
VPLPLSGMAGGDLEAARSRRLATGVAIGVAVFVAIGLLLAAGLGAYLVSGGPFGAHSSVESDLAVRAKKDYPGFTVTAVRTLTHANPAQTGARRTTVYFTLRNVRRPGFVLSAIYDTPAATANDPKAYENSDEFFRAGVSPSQPVDSFIEMWVHAHAVEECYYVYETVDSTNETRTYEVLFTRLVRASGVVTSKQGGYTYSYAPATDTWTQTSAYEEGVPTATPQTSTVPTATPQTSTVPTATTPGRDLSTVVTTATAVARSLPGFEYVVTVFDAPDTLVIVRHKKYPKVQIAVLPVVLSPKANDGMVDMFVGDRARADAFARAWSERHPGVIIYYIKFDPDFVGEADLVEVSFVGSVAALANQDMGVDARLRYNGTRHAWVPAPVPTP